MILLLCLQSRFLLISETRKSKLFTDFICVSFFLLYSPPRLSLVSVVFDFNDSLNDIAPVSPTLLPVVAKRKEKSD